VEGQQTGESVVPRRLPRIDHGAGNAAFGRLSRRLENVGLALGPGGSQGFSQSKTDSASGAENMYFKYLIFDNAEIHVFTMNVLVNLGRFASNPPYGTRAVASQVIQNRLGLHARPAAMFVRTANRHRANIWVQKDGE
jgi:hypothetical protein